MQPRVLLQESHYSDDHLQARCQSLCCIECIVVKHLQVQVLILLHDREVEGLIPYRLKVLLDMLAFAPVASMGIGSSMMSTCAGNL